MISKEEEFIDSVVRRYAAFGRAGDVFGIGDDCAVLPGPDGLKYLVTCDLLTEGTHFAPELTGPRELGIKAAAVNISDIAGMAGRPLWAFVSSSIKEDSEGNIISVLL